MKLKFTKMQGCGNDYIYFDCFYQIINNPSALSVKLSDRRYGIGGDGIILICPSNSADAKMRMFNLDGSEGKMCGNGIRCVGKYLYDNNIVKKSEISIETLSGIKTLKVLENNGKAELLTVNMGKPELIAEKIPVNLNLHKVIDYEAVFGGKNYNITCVSMGNPHCVVFCNDINSIDIEKIGPAFENSELFPEKINTEFVEIVDKNILNMRVWERGSGETLACGTGASAAVVAAVLNGFCAKNENITVNLKGGTLTINYSDDAVYMTGSAKKVFEGVVEV
ncbi:MAG: diaminopimelate epimerase [Acutalibacteraceae bacterium]